MCRTTPHPLQEPCPSCQVGPAVPAPSSAGMPLPPTPHSPLLRGVSRGDAAAPNPVLAGLLPSTDARVQGLLRPGTWDLLFPPLGHGLSGPPVPCRAVGRQGDPAGHVACTSSLRGPAPQQILSASLPPSPSSQACLASAVSPSHTRRLRVGRLRVGRHSACHPRSFRLPFPGQHIASVWGSCGC